MRRDRAKLPKRRGTRFSRAEGKRMDRTAPNTRKDYDAAEVGAIAHLYRGEVYRSTLWRQRLDTTTNWSVVTLGIALSVAYSSPLASPLPLVLVGIVIMFFLLLEARRYRYFNVWRARARWLETHFYAPLLTEGDLHLNDGWQDILSKDYHSPRYHISLFRAVGRRLRRNYIWILLVQTLAFYGKVMVHPTPIETLDQLWERAAVGPVPGTVMVTAGVLYNAAWVFVAIYAWRLDTRYRVGRSDAAMG